MNLKTVKEILNSNEIFVKKRYGQNFLLDENTLKNISSLLTEENMQNVIEIGPGLGFLTKELSKRANKIIAYEIDEEMIGYLQTLKFPNVIIKNKDILKVDLEKEIITDFGGEKVSVVANLPYYITTPILTKLISNPFIDHFVVMMQKEVAERICGKPSTKDYNALSVQIQYYTEAKIAFNVSMKAFYPEPKVESAVVYLKKKKSIDVKALDEKEFNHFLRIAFTNRRKTLVNNLTKEASINKDQLLSLLDKYHLSPSVRAEAIDVNTFVSLFNDLRTI